ncbi:uncharacterized protein IL334_005977 [Kwoniella shivajii]|uniref:FAD dependent oxidoreductase domain-containing protein n=1 Tax=Kwoniella shivajii TaxID=564305 RepID=A0ABZ1D4L7_9TREE|nr:hypothetical protein IL334_005977 [Kwoniella shivajii]
MRATELETGLPPIGMEGGSANISDKLTNLHIDINKIDEPESRPLQGGMSVSHWLGTVRSNPLLDHRTTKELPSSSEVVIIGSGLSGALAALNLLESENPPKSILMLEARELCSGATGRNAGHCKPDIWRGYIEYSKRFGSEQALKILANEKETRDALVRFVTDNNVDCEVWNGKTFDVMMDPEVVAKAARSMEAFKAAGGDASSIDVITDPKEAERVSRVKGAKAVYAWDASTLHPWKLVAYIIERCLKLGLNLQTLTPVSSVTESSKKDCWSIQTERGSVETSNVIHTTNAYAGSLLPELNQSIIPIPHMCNLVYPPSTHSGSKALTNSYAVIYKNGLYSVNPRNTSDGCILFGGVQPNQHQLEKYVSEDPKRKTDDSLQDFKPITESVKFLGKHGFAWDESKPEVGFGVRYDRSWSGIIGLSADEVPFVGPVPGKKGQWMSCGHNGHGMARIFTCSKGLAQLVQGSTWSQTGLPECFQVTSERIGTRSKL